MVAMHSNEGGPKGVNRACDALGTVCAAPNYCATPLILFAIPTGRCQSRLVGLIAGWREAATTVMVPCVRVNHLPQRTTV